MTGYERVRADRSLTARKRYFDHGQSPVGELPGAVLRSWQRCWGAAQQPGRPTSFELITPARVRHLEERNRALLDAASAEVHQLARVVANAKMIVLLTDASGTVVEAAGDFNAINPRLKLAARRGVDMSEEAIGTNAVGTALVERAPVEIIAREHYFESNTVHTCAAAPLFAPDGHPIGAIDISGDYCPDRPNFADVVLASARAIENHMVRRLRGALLLSFGSREDLLGTPWEAIVAFDPGGKLIGANSAARNLLAMPRERPCRRFVDLFAAEFDDVISNVRHDRTSVLTCVSGVRVVARVGEHPATSRAAPSLISGPRLIARHSSASKRESTLAFVDVVSGDLGTAAAIARARRAYDRGAPVLLVGETGTGKELVARGMHCLGARSGRPFIAVNCASLPESLVEAELFGHVEGAFTGARRGGAQGRLELADGGTLFLDEIGDMPLPLQAKLLRVLEERCIVRLGDNRERSLDFLLVCATNQDLRQLIAEKAFREDLYYRINGLCVTLPPLRRRTNILDLANYLLRQEAACELSEACTQLLLSHPWPGNLRQLRHVMTSAVALLGCGSVIGLEHLPEDLLAETGTPDAHATQTANDAHLITLDEAQDALIKHAIRACHGNRSAAARALRISRSTLYNRLKRS